MIPFVERLRTIAADPMWPDHVEVNKRVISAAANEIERLRSLLQEVYDGRERGMTIGLTYRIGLTLNHPIPQPCGHPADATLKGSCALCSWDGEAKTP